MGLGLPARTLNFLSATIAVDPRNGAELVFWHIQMVHCLLAANGSFAASACIL